MPFYCLYGCKVKKICQKGGLGAAGSQVRISIEGSITGHFLAFCGNLIYSNLVILVARHAISIFSQYMQLTFCTINSKIGSRKLLEVDRKDWDPKTTTLFLVSCFLAPHFHPVILLLKVDPPTFAELVVPWPTPPSNSAHCIAFPFPLSPCNKSLP